MNIVNKFFKWVFDKWLAGFITATIFFLLKLYIELPSDKKGIFFNFKWLAYILNTKYEVWKILILVFLLLLLYFLKKRYFSSTKQIKFEKIPNQIKSYTSDKFGINNSIWTWVYGWNKYGKYLISQITALCPVCSASMNQYSNLNKAICTRCRLEQRKYEFNTEDPFDVELEIKRRIETYLKS